MSVCLYFLSLGFLFVRKSLFWLTRSFFKLHQLEGLSGRKRLFKQGKSYVIPHQIKCNPSSDCMFSLVRLYVFRGKKQCFPCFRTLKPPFSGFRPLAVAAFCLFFFQNFCKDFAILLGVRKKPLQRFILFHRPFLRAEIRNSQAVGMAKCQNVRKPHRFVSSRPMRNSRWRE